MTRLLLFASAGAGGHGGDLPAWLGIAFPIVGVIALVTIYAMRRGK